MSLSAFSFDDFDSLLNLASVDVPLPLSALSTRSPSLIASSLSTSFLAAPHGESPRFVAVGVSLFGGQPGGATGVENGGPGTDNSGGIGGPERTLGGGGTTPTKRAGLLLEPSPATLCLGLMASAKFCTWVIAEGSLGCGAAAHVRKFMPPPSSAFVKDTEVRAFCSSILDLSIISPVQRLRIQGVPLTASEWVHLFQQVRQRTPPKWLAFEDPPAVTIDPTLATSTVELLSPTDVASGAYYPSYQCCPLTIVLPPSMR
jgi:hypothetical protein